MPGTSRAKEPPIKTPTIESLSLEERIRRRAYELYVQRGDQSGSELDDWLQAEEEIRSARSKPSTKPDFGPRQHSNKQGLSLPRHEG